MFPYKYQDFEGVTYDFNLLKISAGNQGINFSLAGAIKKHKTIFSSHQQINTPKWSTVYIVSKFLKIFFVIWAKNRWF